MIKTLIPGSFDPITIGHVDLIKRAAKIFDEVYVGVMVNKDKNYLFNLDERKEMINKVFVDYPNIKIVASNGLTVDLCKEIECNILVKGVRTNADYEYELNQANINTILDDGIETILLFAKPQYSVISSSNIKNIWKLKGDIKPFIPDEIYHDVITKLTSLI